MGVVRVPRARVASPVRMPAGVAMIPPGIFDVVIAVKECRNGGAEELNSRNDPEGETGFQHGAAFLRSPADVGAWSRDLDISQVGCPVISSSNID